MAFSEQLLLFLKNGRLATGGTNTTLIDADADWTVDIWKDVPVKIRSGTTEYTRKVTSNTATQLTFPALPVGVVVAAGDAFFFLPDLATLLAILAGAGLSYKGIVTAAVPGVSFTIDSLKSLGAGLFGDPTAPYRAFVMRDAGGAEAAPQGEMAAITSYTTATGLFTPNGPPAFTVNIAVGDEVLILHPRLAEVFDILTRFNAAGAAMSVVSQPGVAARTNLNAILTDLADILAGAAGITNFPAAAVPADGVSLAEVIRQIYNDLVALNNAKPNVLDVVIYPVAEDVGVTEITDAGANPPYYPVVVVPTLLNVEPGATAWSEDINFEQQGTINLISIFLEMEWQTRFVNNGGAGTNSISKVQISRDGGANWVDVTDNFTNPAVVMTNHIRQGIGLWVTTIVTGVNQLMIRLCHWTDDATGVDASEAQIRSNTRMEITYRKS